MRRVYILFGVLQIVEIGQDESVVHHDFVRERCVLQRIGLQRSENPLELRARIGVASRFVFGQRQTLRGIQRAQAVRSVDSGESVVYAAEIVRRLVVMTLVEQGRGDSFFIIQGHQVDIAQNATMNIERFAIVLQSALTIVDRPVTVARQVQRQRQHFFVHVRLPGKRDGVGRRAHRALAVAFRLGDPSDGVKRHHAIGYRRIGNGVDPRQRILGQIARLRNLVQMHEFGRPVAFGSDDEQRIAIYLF